VLSWKRRYDIILGIAKSLFYLHEESHCHIIHRDIKGRNILLGYKGIPKIVDFGMAYLHPEHQTHVNTVQLVPSMSFIYIYTPSKK
ncbi:receptor-like serine/threonine-protein kinase sd1-7, partial [Phtheirospermum japonicum]